MIDPFAYNPNMELHEEIRVLAEQIAIRCPSLSS
jgi:hypothetical protein